MLQQGRSVRRALAVIVLSVSVATASHTDAAAREEQVGYDGSPPGGYAMAVDGLLARPVLLGMTLVGVAVYLVTLPFSAIGGNAGAASEQLVVSPARATFTRCLGCVEPKQRALEMELPQVREPVSGRGPINYHRIPPQPRRSALPKPAAPPLTGSHELH